MSKISIQFYKTPYGELLLGDFRGQLCICDWHFRKMRQEIDKRITKRLAAEFVEEDTELLVRTRDQLEEYFTFKRKTFDLELLMVGTDFQKRVWQELINIAFGKTLSYLSLAERIGNANAVRAVASANGANAISIIVPCHRVVGSKGELVGYAGGLKAKEKLLMLELEQDMFSLCP